MPFFHLLKGEGDSQDLFPFYQERMDLFLPTGGGWKRVNEQGSTVCNSVTSLAAMFKRTYTLRPLEGSTADTPIQAAARHYRSFRPGPYDVIAVGRE